METTDAGTSAHTHFSMQPQSTLHFWFTELTPKQHFAKVVALDETIRTRFIAALEATAKCELFAWRATPESRLAEVLVLDQFSRNVYRDTPRALAQEALAQSQWPSKDRKLNVKPVDRQQCPPR